MVGSLPIWAEITFSITSFCDFYVDHHGATQGLIELIVILVLAKVGAYIFELLKQPSVLGELCIGILLGNLAFITGGRIEIFNFFRTDEFIHLFSEIGVIILLFEIGLQSNIRELLKVGGPALR